MGRISHLGRPALGLSALFVVISFLTGCKTWDYARDHRGIFPIVCTFTNIPFTRVDLDSFRSEEKHSFGPAEEPAVVIVGYTDDVKLNVLDLSTGKIVAVKRLYCDWSHVTIQPLNIQKKGRYKIYFHSPRDPLTSCDISVTRVPKTTTPAKLNDRRTSLLGYSPLLLELNPKLSWGNYDAAFIASVEKKWYDLLDNEAVPKHGSVVLRFRLGSDGRVSDLEIVKNTSDPRAAVLCKNALLDLAPYPPRPEELRKQLGVENRKIQFTFYY